MNKKAINENILSGIDWEEIHGYYIKLNIIWNIETPDGKIVHKVPEISDIREEVVHLLEHMITSDSDYISYGNWIIFHDRKTDDTRIIFRLSDITYTHNSEVNSIDNSITKTTLTDLTNTLNKFVLDEDYESAAFIRDKINYLKGVVK